MARLIIEESFKARVETVWKAITDKDQMRQWYFEMLESFRPEVGFKTQFNVEHGGKNYLHLWEVTEACPGEKSVTLGSMEVIPVIR